MAGVAKEWADAFAKAGHVQSKTHLRCEKCGTTLYEFVRKGGLPCLVA